MGLQSIWMKMGLQIIGYYSDGYVVIKTVFLGRAYTENGDILKGKPFISSRMLVVMETEGAESPIRFIEVTGALAIDYNVRDYCTLPYPGHPEGCPNYGKRKECPPSAPLVEDFIDLSKPHYFVVYTLDYADTESMDGKLQACWSYWHRNMKSILCETIGKFQSDHPGTVFTLHPSAVGVDVLETAKNVGIPLEISPQGTVYRIALLGYPVDRE